jgi:hypothetical protein
VHSITAFDWLKEVITFLYSGVYQLIGDITTFTATTPGNRMSVF